MNSEKDNLHEIFDLLPLGLEFYGSIGGEKIFSNKKISDYILKYLSTSPATKDIHPGITKGVETKNIVIGYVSKDKLRFLWSRFRTWVPHLWGRRTIFLGWFSSEEDKIAIILDDNTNIFGKSIREIPPILTHELCHYIANNDPDTFMRKLTNPFLLPYYTSLVNLIDTRTESIPDKELEKTIYRLVFKIEVSDSTNLEINEIGSIWRNYYQLTNAPKSEVDLMIIKTISPFLRIYGRAGKYTKIAEESVNHFYKAYKSVGVPNADNITLCGQEASFPSEVICISNQFKPSLPVISLINQIKF